MALIEGLPRARAALEDARAGETARIAEAVRSHRVVGVLGEAEVGKTKTVCQALTGLSQESRVIALDLDGAASDTHVAFLLAKQIARAELEGADLSLLSGGALIPSRLEAKRVRLAELLGTKGVDEALREWPSGDLPLERMLTALQSMARQHRVVLWIDHVEAPALTPRHPLHLDRLLWGLREMAQRETGLHLVLSGREAIAGEILSAASAFHQQGKWLSIDVPSLETWLTVGERLEAPRAGTREVVELLEGHPATMLLAMLRLVESPRLPHAYGLVQELVSSDVGLTARAMQHARSLHRLGGQVLVQIAYGQRPYAGEQRGKGSSQEVTKVLGRLQLAGLLRHGADGWSVVNPLVAMGIRQRVWAPPREIERASPSL